MATLEGNALSCGMDLLMLSIFRTEESNINGRVAGDASSYLIEACRFLPMNHEHPIGANVERVGKAQGEDRKRHDND